MKLILEFVIIALSFYVTESIVMHSGTLFWNQLLYLWQNYDIKRTVALLYNKYLITLLKIFICTPVLITGWEQSPKWDIIARLEIIARMGYQFKVQKK